MSRTLSSSCCRRIPPIRRRVRWRSTPSPLPTTRCAFARFSQRPEVGSSFRRREPIEASFSSSKRGIGGLSEFSNELPDHARLELDFFGEPVTFQGLNSADNNKTVTTAMGALDGFLLTVVSKGKSSIGGGDEAGLEIKSAHSVAVSWSELLRHAAVWNASQEDGTNRRAAPMLAVVAVAPVLAQAGIAYVRHLDSLLKQAKPGAPGLPAIQMMTIAEAAVSRRDDKNLNARERAHLRALHWLLEGDYPKALLSYLQLLRSCPGDVLALSLAMDLSLTIGDKQAALRAAGSAASYWNERRGGIIRPAIPGHAMASSLMALGLAVGGRHDDAEQMAERAMNQGKSVCGGLATWAQTHVFDAGGRVAEGISALANLDGIANYEGSGLLFFDCRLGGYGARFSLDREERGRGKSAALRLYEVNFERVLDYSGFAQGRPWRQPLRSAPLAWTDTKAIEDDTSSRSLMDKILGRGKPKKLERKDYELIVKRANHPSTELDGWEPACEDVLTWLPPTPQFLSDATLLLLRFTLNGTISARNARWDSVRHAWTSMLDIQRKYSNSTSLTFCPLACVAASLLFPPSATGGDQIGSGRLAEGLYAMGELLKLGNPVTEEEKTTAVREVIADNDPNFWLPSNDNEKEEWRRVVNNLVSAIDGTDYLDGGFEENDGVVDDSLRFRAWDFEARPILEHALVYAACKSGDTDSLCLARSICSQGVTLRVNSPEEWWRYSIVLGLLGDDVGSENALFRSIGVGGGQGSRS